MIAAAARTAPSRTGHCPLPRPRQTESSRSGVETTARRTIAAVYRTIGFADSTAVIGMSTNEYVDPCSADEDDDERAAPRYAASRRSPHTAAADSAIDATTGSDRPQPGVEEHVEREAERVDHPVERAAEPPSVGASPPIVARYQRRHGTAAASTARAASRSRPRPGVLHASDATRATPSAAAAKSRPSRFVSVAPARSTAAATSRQASPCVSQARAGGRRRRTGRPRGRRPAGSGAVHRSAGGRARGRATARGAMRARAGGGTLRSRRPRRGPGTSTGGGT